VQYYVDGGKYDGNWEEGVRSGMGSLVLVSIGTYYYPNGDVYEGKWENDQMCEPPKPDTKNLITDVIKDIEGIFFALFIETINEVKKEVEESIIETEVEQVTKEGTKLYKK